MSAAKQTKRAAPGRRSPDSSRPTHARTRSPEPQGRVADLLLHASALISACLLPLVMMPQAANAFGPPKLLVLAVATTCAAIGFALAPARLMTVCREALRSPVAIAGGVFFLAALASMFTSIDRLHSMLGSYPEYQGLVTLGCWVLIGLATVSLGSGSGWQAILARAITLTLLAAGIYGVMQRLGLDPLASPAGAKLSHVRSTLGNSSNFGVFLLLALPFALDRLRFDVTRAWRWLGGLSCAVCMVCLLWASSRGAWLGFLVGAAVYVGLEMRARGVVSGRRAALVAISLVLVFGVAVAVTPSAASRAKQVLDPSVGTGRWRLVMWASVLDMAFDRPALGWGANSLRYVYPAYRTESAGDAPIDIGVLGNAHNAVVDAAASVGFVGALALLGWWAMVVRALWRLAGGSSDTQRVAWTLGAALAGAAVAFMFHFATLDTGSVIAVLMGVLIAAEGQMAEGAESSGGAGRRSAHSAAVPASARIASLVIAILAIGLLLGSAGLLAADHAVLEARSSAVSGDTWQRVRRHLKAAQRLAPWEVAVWRVGGTAAGDSIRAGSTAQGAMADGLADLSRAGELAPRDTSLAADRADLLLAGATATHSIETLDKAQQAIEQAIDSDPNNGAYWIMKGVTIATAGDVTAAIPAFERGVALAPRSRGAWDVLAQAYQTVGRTDDARRAHAEGLAANRR